MAWLDNEEKWFSFNKFDEDLRDKLFEFESVKNLLEDSFY